jgi:tRNA (uracil-5-)-methyltransferase TRM9
MADTLITVANTTNEAPPQRSAAATTTTTSTLSLTNTGVPALSVTTAEETNSSVVAAVVVPETTDAVTFEAQHVHDIYDRISGHFSSTRYKAWPLVRRFVEGLPHNALLADVGCGNGKNLSLASHVRCIGCDYSASLLKIASAQHLEVFRADGLRTSFRSGVFDAVMSIAVIHHFSSRERRCDAIRELLRIVRPDGGLVLIYVWAKEQPRRKGFMDVNGDILVPWEMHKKFDDMETVHGRYYHLFGAGELEALCQEAAGTTMGSCSGGDASGCNTTAGGGSVSIASTSILHAYFDKENWCVVLRRGSAERQEAEVSSSGA